MSADEKRQQKDPKSFKAGEVVPMGSYVCSNCGNRVVMENEGVLHPCSECYGTKFKHG